MRLALMVYGRLSVRTGGNIYDLKLVEHLEATGNRVDLIELPLVPFERALSHNLPDSVRRELAARLGNERYDAILQDELIHPSVLGWNESISSATGAPIVSIVHHLRSNEEWPRFATELYRRLETVYLSSVDGFVFNSETTKRAVDSLVSLVDRPYVIATPGGDRLAEDLATESTDWHSLVRERLKTNALAVLFVGNLIPRKGLLTLIEAVAALPDLSLHLVGREDADAEYAARLRDRVDELNLVDRVCFQGELSDGELAALMRRCHVFAMPSTYEGFGIAYLEAMSFALPVIAGDRGAAGDLVDDSNGRLIRPDRKGELEAALAALAIDRERLERLSLGARATYERYPTWQESGERVRSFLSQWLTATTVRARS